MTVYIFFSQILLVSGQQALHFTSLKGTPVEEKSVPPGLSWRSQLCTSHLKTVLSKAKQSKAL